MGMKFLQLYFTYRDALDELSDEECGQLVKSLLQYAMDGVQPELPKHSLVRQTFLLMARQIDFDAGCYEKRSAGGKRGGRPRKTEKEPETESENQDADTEKASETLYKPIETFEKQGFQKKPCSVEVMGGLSKKEKKGKEKNHHLSMMIARRRRRFPNSLIFLFRLLREAGCKSKAACRMRLMHLALI